MVLGKKENKRITRNNIQQRVKQARDKEETSETGNKETTGNLKHANMNRSHHKNEKKSKRSISKWQLLMEYRTSRLSSSRI